MDDNKQLSRVPRTLSDERNASVFETLNEIGGSIGLDIITYVSSIAMKDLYGECWFSMNDFCEKMGYDRTKLQRRLSEEQLDNLFNKNRPIYIDETGSQKIEHPIETLFEVMLYKLGSTNLNFVEPKTGKGETKYSFIQILESFKIRTNFKTNKKTKRLYYVQLNKQLRNTLFNQYNIIELNDYSRLPDRKGYRLFYMNLSKMIFLIKFKIKESQKPCYTLTVDQLAKIFDINIVSNSDRKKKVSAILDSINEYLKSTNFKYTYIKGENERWAYTVQFEFPVETLELFDQKFKTVFSSRFYAAMENLYLQVVKNIPVSQVYRYKETVHDEYNRDFIEWLYSDQDVDKKREAYRKTFIDIFNQSPEDYGLESQFDFILSFMKE